MSASCQPPRCGCIVSTISLWLHCANLFVVAASKQQSRIPVSIQQARCGYIEATISLRLQQATISLLLYRGTTRLVAASRHQSLVVTASNQSFCRNLISLYRSSKLIVCVSRQQYRCGLIEPTPSLWLHRGNNLVVLYRANHLVVAPSS